MLRPQDEPFGYHLERLLTEAESSSWGDAPVATLIKIIRLYHRAIADAQDEIRHATQDPAGILEVAQLEVREIAKRKLERK